MVTGVGDDEEEGNVKINKTDGHRAVLKVSQAYVPKYAQHEIFLKTFSDYYRNHFYKLV